MSEANDWNYEAIKLMARQYGCRVTDLIALAVQNDPFYAGTAADRQGAEWFADLWQRFGYTWGVHIRRVHYQIISQDPPVMMPDGTVYENTERCWKYLNMASKMARDLGLVDAAAFVDRRNPDPHVYAYGRTDEPELSVYDNFWSADLALPSFPSLPSYEIHNYAGVQRYHVEIWCEKSTMNDVLLPLCSRYGLNLVTGVGEISATACLELVRNRINGRPVRILYVSDFDPAGQSMPVAAARKIEFFLRSDGIDADVRLYPVVLSADQVRQYRLPRTPIKDTERRAGRFEERYGEGAVELDALEALHPGALRNIIRTEIERYFDADLDERVEKERRKLEHDADRIRRAIIERHRDELKRLGDEYREISDEFADRIAKVQGEVSRLWEVIAEAMVDQAPNIDAYPVPDADEAFEPDAALFDSSRDYVDQISAYKAFQGKDSDILEVTF